MTRKRRRAELWTPIGHEGVHADTTLFGASQGHGFAAERANHVSDVISGKRAELVGGNNVKDGPDRLVNGVAIQTKYHQTGARSVASCFEGGRYRYINPDGSPMPIEVPYDHYDDALGAMGRRIANGDVPGVTDPVDAPRLVKRGFATYAQAVNVCKFGMIESLTYDAINGVKVGGSAFGVSAAVAYALAVWRGESATEALDVALSTGLSVGRITWWSSVLTAQLGRTQLGGLLGANVLTSVATTLVLSPKHFVRLFRGEVSGAQAFKDVATDAAYVAGGVVGWQAGARMGAGLGAAGSLIGGVLIDVVAANLCGSTVRTLVGNFIEDDAVDSREHLRAPCFRPSTHRRRGCAGCGGSRLVRPRRYVEMHVRIR